MLNPVFVWTLLALLAAASALAGDKCFNLHKTRTPCDEDKTTDGGCVWCDIVDRPPFCTDMSNAKQWPQPPAMPPWRCDVPQESGYPIRRLNNGVDMPVIALGTGGYNNSEAVDAVIKALQNGLNHVHSAFDYFNLPGVAKGLATKPRESIFLTTMTSPCVHLASAPKRNVTDPDECYKLTTRELEESLELLQVEYVDLLMLHGPSEPFGYEGGCDGAVCELNKMQWKAYAEFYRNGKARAIGVSNYCQSCLKCLLDSTFEDRKPVIVPAVNQIQLHVGMGHDPEGLFSFCSRMGITSQAYSPLAAGEVVSDPLCTSLGTKYNKSAAQVGLRWIIQQDFSPALVVKSDKIKDLESDLDIFSWSLSEDDMTDLSKATTPTGQQDGRPSWGCAE